MLQTLKDLFDSLLPPARGAPAQSAEHTLQLAAAVLLVEVMRADTSFHATERNAVLAALRKVFHLADDEAQRLAELARPRRSRPPTCSASPRMSTRISTWPRSCTWSS